MENNSVRFLTRRYFLKFLLFGSAGINSLHPARSTEEEPNYKVHIFYYQWYGNLATDGAWQHWDEKGHTPAADIATNYYPLLGPYSSSDRAVLRQHMRWIKFSRAGVLCLSFWGRYSYTDLHIPMVMDLAQLFGLKVTFHLAAYLWRKQTFIEDIIYLLEQYGDHPAFYRTEEKKPLFYLYNSTVRADSPDYIADDEWAFMLNQLRSDKKSTAIFIGHTSDLGRAVNSTFDGIYTYGAFHNIEVWKSIAEEARRRGLLWCPSISPGYIDVKAKEYVNEETRVMPRKGGERYRETAKAAIDSKADILTITSFNEFHEGTQIEPVMSWLETPGYMSYYPQKADHYLQLTREIVQNWEMSTTQKS
jgi:glycoprotein endo-alpha-1,2-mannosidase